MKIHLENAIFINRAPFDKLELKFKENEIAVLSAVNGRGKTTILSHIVDSFYEMMRPHFPIEFKEKENKLYRVSGSYHNLVQNQPSFVYLRYKTPDVTFDYVDVRNKCTKDQYDEFITIENKIPFNDIASHFEMSNYIKKVSSNFNKNIAEQILLNNILTYFPSYRFEMPGYLNDPYKVKLDFKIQPEFSGYLRNPIEVISGLQQLANWIMDIVLDLRMDYKVQDEVIFSNLNLILTQSLISKKYGPLRFGVGLRGLGVTRIQILQDIENGITLYPSIFNLSSGESSMLCLFGELLRQADNYKNNIKLAEINGIVIIDEVDKHLHIKLQKEILPKLFKLLPNIQFIVSSHSPFLSMGLAEEAQERSKIIDLDNLGISNDPTTNDLYTEVYNMMIGENERFKEMYQLLEKKIQEGEMPLIITEGETDVKHIKKAKEKLKIDEYDLEFYEIVGEWGDSKLKLLLEQLSKVQQKRKIIGIFDRDVPNIVSDLENNNQSFKDYTNNVYGFCIPIPVGRKNYKNISIEFYYSDEELKKEYDGKCLYFDNELNFDSKRKPKSSIADAQDNLEKKIWCENIGALNWIHSKSRFAELIETDEDFTSDFDFSKFNLLFDKIKAIIYPAEED
jgi:predicted ATP-binding protein involved in virulence